MMHCRKIPKITCLFPRKKIFLAIVFVCLFPYFAFAATSPTTQTYLNSAEFKAMPVYSDNTLQASKKDSYLSQLNGEVNGKRYAIDSNGKLYMQDKGGVLGTGQTYYRDLTTEEQKNINVDTAVMASNTTIAQQKQQQQQQSLGIVGNIVFDGLKGFIMWLANGILWLFSWVVWLGAITLKWALEAPTKFGGFTKSSVVVVGWPIVRDLANMFFALILLVISFATILRVETYGMKQVLWRLVVAALLINFSLVIAGVIIDGSNVLTNFFVNPSSFQIRNTDGSSQPANDISEAILSGLKIHKIYNTNLSAVPTGGVQTQVQGDPGFTTIFLNVILGTVFMMITAFIFFAAAILFYIRMIALWILLIFAPLAWLAMILPATRSLWSKWWHEFTKWIIFAPVYGFFIYLTVSMLTNDVLKQSATGQADASGLPIGEFFQDINMIQNYIILSIFMLAGLIFARQSGIAGANTVANMGKAYGRFFSRWAARGGKVPGATWAAQKLGVTQKLDAWQKEGTGFQKGLANVLRGAGKVKSTAFTAMSPQVWSRYWAYREQRANAASFDGGAGRLDAFATGFTGAIRNFRGASQAKQEQLSKEEAQKIYEARMRGDRTYEGHDISGPTIDAMLHARGIQPGTPQAEEFMRQHDWEQAQDIAKNKIVAGGAVAGLGATFEGMFGKGRLEQIAESREVGRRQQEFSQTLRDEDQIVDYYTKAKDPVDREALFRLIASINGLNTLFARLKTDFNPKNLSQYMQQNFRGGRGEVLAADVSAMASQSGNFSFVGTTAWDASQGKIRFATEAEQKATAVKKALEMEGQAWARLTHPDSWVDRDATGRPAKISDFSKEMLNQMTGAHIKQIDRFQGRTLTALYNFRGDFRNYINSTLSGQQQQIANSFIDAVENRYTRAT